MRERLKSELEDIKDVAVKSVINFLDEYRQNEKTHFTDDERLEVLVKIVKLEIEKRETGKVLS